MAWEIERKFLVNAEFAAYRQKSPEKFVPHRIEQGYLASAADGAPFGTRIRRMDNKAFLTLKSRTRGIVRREYEYEIPLADAIEMLDALRGAGGATIEKTRYITKYAGKTWEIDVFAGANDGLIVAEIELAAEGEPFDRPPWLAAEVSADPRYLNSHLVRCPYTTWPHDE